VIHDALQPRTDLRRRVLAGEVTFGAFAGLASPIAAEILGRTGLDWAILDLEHSTLTEADLLPGIYALQATPATALVRVEEGTRLRIGRALDFGAEGLMIPRLDTVEQVDDAVSWMRFPPDGIRGLALSTRGAGQSSVAHADVYKLNALPIGIFQIESPVAVANAEAMAAIDGVDVLFVGPADLSHALGVPGRFADPTFIEAIERVAQAAGKHGKAAGILLKGSEDVPAYLDRGYTFIGLGSDGGWISSGVAAVLGMARTFLG
jgi:2-keto-3-deoxy-L-rhamnonate aldolase RhmA